MEKHDRYHNRNVVMDLTNNKGTLHVALVLAIAWIACFSPTSAQQQKPPQQSLAKSEIVVADLENRSDFSISRDGETIFVAEPAKKQIRRIKGDSNAVVITGIERKEDEASAISVFAIDDNRILLGVAGFSSPSFAVTLFDLSVVDNLPLDFADDLVQTTRNFQRKSKRAEAFDVLNIFEQQRGISIVRKIGDEKPNLCDITLKGGALETLADADFQTEISNPSDLSTLAVDPLGGYFVTVAPDSDSTSKLVFSRAEGMVIQSFSLNLSHVKSLGFTPESQRLYALVGEDDSESKEPSVRAGIYEILSNDKACSAELVLSIDQPQKMKIDAQGDAWVLCKTDVEKSHLLRVTGLNGQRSK